MKREKITLTFDEMPKSWYNLKADLPFKMDPMLNPGTGEPVKKEELAPLFPKSLIDQEFDAENVYIPIPEEVLNEYKIYRPAPLVHATGLEEYLNTPAKIYFKNESVSPTGSHKVNTAIAQAFYNKQDGFTKLTTETGAGQWGSALSYAGNKFGLDVEIYMVRVSHDLKPGRRHMMHLFNGNVYPSPSNRTEAGKRILAEDPDCNGSLGMAITDAVELAVQSDDTNYALGSVLDHVLLHQTIIGEELKLQLEKAGIKPDVMIACVGGGSNFGGFAFPFVMDAINNKDLKIIASEPEACPTLKKGKYEYDFGDTGKLTPMMKMYTLGYGFMPPPIHAGGLRYHGASPIISRLVKEGIVDVDDLPQNEILKAAQIFTMAEGIIPAPESSHAVASTIREAIKCRETGEEKTIVFNLSGHGFMDLSAYDHIGKL
jgi:tryptophan synthase beta chain